MVKRKIANGIEKNCCVLPDLSKAFDCVIQGFLRAKFYVLKLDMNTLKFT